MQEALRASRAQHANIEEPKTSESILNHPKLLTAQAIYTEVHPLISNHFGESLGGPEKAGVGGSILSLATI